MGEHLRARRVLVGLTLVALLGGCAPHATSPPSPTMGPPSATPAPATSPIPSPAAASTAVAVVTGTADCPGLDFDFTTDAEGIWHVRDDYHADRCTLTTDDPRVSGVRSSTWNFDLWGNPSAGIGAGVQWGTPRLENDGGAWEGRATGVVSLPGRGDIIVNWYKGTGGYAGLAYFELWTGSGPWTIQGQIFPGDPPTPAGMSPVPVATTVPSATASPTTAPSPLSTPLSYGPVTVVTGTGTFLVTAVESRTTDADGVMHGRGATVECTRQTDDPRVSGTVTGAVNMDAWGDPNAGTVAGDLWGTVRLENDGGAWEGRVTGVDDEDHGTILAIWFKGTGGYAGLSYFELLTGPGIWKIQGQIFPGDPPAP